MSSLVCPRCSTSMDVVESPDITYVKCPDCDGTFVGKEEIDAFATGRTGDVCFTSIDDDEEKQDEYSRRSCPLCDDREMEKKEMLFSSSVIVDVCPDCEGHFFDPDEIQLMNQKLRELTDVSFSEEYRAKHGEFLVRLDKGEEWVAEASLSGVMTGTQSCHRGFNLQASIFFPEPLDAGLELTEGGWGESLLEVFDFGLRGDITTGNPEFDSTFRISGDDPDRIRSILNRSVQRKMIVFLREKPSMLGKEGILKMTDERVLLQEGPYSEGGYNMEKDPKQVRSSLIEIAKAVLD